MVGHVLSQPTKFAGREIENDVEFTGTVTVKRRRGVLNRDVTNPGKRYVRGIIKVLIFYQFDESLRPPICKDKRTIGDHIFGFYPVVTMRCDRVGWHGISGGVE